VSKLISSRTVRINKPNGAKVYKEVSSAFILLSRCGFVRFGAFKPNSL